MTELRVGMLAKSKAGHDKGQLYVIIDIDDEYVYLVDGIYKTLKKPKKKRKKHIQRINYISETFHTYEEKGREIRDEQIKRIIKLYRETDVVERV
jgi:ribosomal protein L14E/L6E/L27E